MEYLPNDKMLRYNHNTLEEVRQAFGLNKPGAMKNAVDNLEEWVKQQKHFTTRNFDRRYLETTIIVSKGSLERAKSRLDSSCTLRTLMPHIFSTYDIRHYYETVLKDVKHAVLPSMTKNNERVYLMRNYGKKFEPSLVDSFNRTIPALAEYLRLRDYSVGNYVVIDYLEVNLIELAKAFKISALQELAAYLLECCGFRLKALYIISSSRLVDVIVALFKQILSAKLGSRIQVLKDREALHEVIDKDILPVEYGGKEKSLDELHDDWIEVFYSEDHIQYLNEICSARTDESLRQKDKFNSEYMGMPGTFRTISVD